MITPNIPHQSTPVLNPDGTMHDSWHRFLSQMTSALQDSNSEEGLVAGAQTLENISLLNTPASAGRMIYDKTNNVMKINNYGIYQEIGTRPESLTTAQIAAIPPSKINGIWVTNSDNGKIFFGVNGSFRQVAYT
jgi:hypothetical protein